MAVKRLGPGKFLSTLTGGVHPSYEKAIYHDDREALRLRTQPEPEHPFRTLMRVLSPQLPGNRPPVDGHGKGGSKVERVKRPASGQSVVAIHSTGRTDRPSNDPFAGETTEPEKKN